MRGTWFPAGAALVLGVAACSGGEQLQNAEGELLVSPRKLVFDRGYVGYPSEARVRLQNTGRTELLVEVAIEGPFQTSAGPYRLAGPSDVTQAIVFTPGAEGEFEGVVRYTMGGEVFEVLLTGRATVPETCIAKGACSETWFDTATGTCQSRDLPEGASCQTGNACLVDGICRNHECLGTQLDCDDGNPCTKDTCDPLEGCRRAEVTCDPDPNPCKKMVCVPDEGGCVPRNDDGKECGERTEGCADWHLCRGGACQSFGVPNGKSCRDPCGEGTCQDKVCVRDTPGVLDETPGWTSEPVAPERSLFFPGLVTGDGTLVWLEPALDGSNTWLATAGPAEAAGEDDPPFEQRYRDVVLAGVPGRAGAMLAGDAVVVALDGPGGGRFLEARHVADGAPAWGPADVATLLAFEPFVPEDFELLALVDAGVGGVRAVARAAGRTAVLPLAVDGTPGPVAWFDGTPVAAEGEPVAIADADGRLYLTLRTETEGRVVSLYGDNSPRWETPAADDEGGPLAVAGGLLVIAPGRVLDTRDGTPLFDLPVLAAAGLGGPARSPILGAGVGFVARDGDLATPPVLVSFDPATGEEVASRDLVLEDFPGHGSWTAPLLTTRKNAVVTVQFVPEGGTTAAMLVSGLLEFRSDGEPARACRIPGLGALAGPPAIRGGWFAFAESRGAVKLYDLRRGAEPAASGWAGPRGGPAGGNREVR